MDLASNAVSLQLVVEEVVADLVKGLRKVHDKDVDLFASLEGLRCFVDESEQLGVT
jgi:hypothetical protein